MPNKSKILAGRKAVEAYRIAHAQLHSKPWHRNIPEEHTPLLETLVDALGRLAFNSPNEFWDDSNLLNIQELGYSDMEDFRTKAKKADREALKGMWH